MQRHPVALIGSENIGTDPMIKIRRLSKVLDLIQVAGVDPASQDLAAARRMGIATGAEGVEGLIRLPRFRGLRGVRRNPRRRAPRRSGSSRRPWAARHRPGPGGVGPFVVPSVNIGQNGSARVVNMVIRGGQATVPIVTAVGAVAQMRCAEVVASIASQSAGPGTRANIDEFTRTTARALEVVGGAGRGKAIIILNPAEPPLTMRDTAICLTDPDDPEAIANAVDGPVRPLQDRPVRVDRQTLTVGHPGGHSSVLRRAERASELYWVDARGVLVEAGRRKPGGGQGDMLVDIAPGIVWARA